MTPYKAYILERTVAIAAGCPIALADEHISTELPFVTEVPQFRDLNDVAKRKHFINHVQAYQLQSHIHSVQLFNQPLPEQSPDYNSWVETTKESIERLVAQIAHDGVAPSWLVMATRQCQVLLYRPCSRNIAPTTWSLVAAARASIDFIKSSLDVVTAGGFVLAFELSNCCFHAGMVLLYILNNHGSEDELANITQDCQEALDILLQVFVSLTKKIPPFLDPWRRVSMLIISRIFLPRDGQPYLMPLIMFEDLGKLASEIQQGMVHIKKTLAF